jgi:hypothetical protein
MYQRRHALCLQTCMVLITPFRCMWVTGGLTTRPCGAAKTPTAPTVLYTSYAHTTYITEHKISHHHGIGHVIPIIHSLTKIKSRGKDPDCTALITPLPPHFALFPLCLSLSLPLSPLSRSILCPSLSPSLPTHPLSLPLSRT